MDFIGLGFSILLSIIMAATLLFNNVKFIILPFQMQIISKYDWNLFYHSGVESMILNQYELITNMTMVIYNKAQSLTSYLHIIDKVQKRMQSIVDEPKIHFFEFMEIQILHQYIQTGIEYMVKSILNSNQKLVSLRYYSHEIATLISAIKNIYFLIKHKAMYVENFYGFQRVNKRSKIHVLLEIIIWVILPYIFRKIQNKFNGLKEKEQNGNPLSLFSRIFTKIFPVLYCLLKLVSTAMKFRYLIIPESKFYNPDYCITKTELAYLQQQQPSPYPIMSFLKSPGLFFLLAAHKVASAFFSSNSKKKRKEEGAQIVSAPINEKKQKLCPICGRDFKNAAVLRSSGYVFCYNCILPEIKGKGKCPVTEIPSDQNQIQIIYE